jgi:hypothetical protein
MGERLGTPQDNEVLRHAFCDPKPGSISSLRCQKSRTRIRKGYNVRSDVFADDKLGDRVGPSSPKRATPGTTLRLRPAWLRHA